MPSSRKRIGFLPSEEVHEIIEKLCTANKFSQSKVTGLLVEEALRSRGVLNEPYGQNHCNSKNLINFSFDEETFSENNKSLLNVDEYAVNKEVLSDNIKMMHEFIEFKYFKKVMKRNNNNVVISLHNFLKVLKLNKFMHHFNIIR